MTVLTLGTRAIPIAIFALLFSQLVYGHALNLEKRGPCYHDNCLRALLGNSAVASPFCSAYLGPTHTTTTVPFTSVCTENPTAVSTACSCLLIATTTTSTSTSSTSSAAAGPTQCLAANNYGYLYQENTFSFESLVIFPQVETSVTHRGDCCRLCYSHPNCYGFAESSSSAEPTYLFCELEIIQPSTGLDVSSECPLGKVQLDLGYGASPYNPASFSGDGQGPCGIFRTNGQL